VAIESMGGKTFGFSGGLLIYGLLQKIYIGVKKMSGLKISVTQVIVN